MKFRKNILILSLLIAVVSCKNSGGYTTSPAPKNALVAAYAELDGSVSKVGGLHSSARFGQRHMPVALDSPVNAFGSDWTLTDFLINPKDLLGAKIGFSTWIQNWVDQEAVDLNGNSVGSLKHFNETLKKFCFTSLLLSQIDNDDLSYPKTGLYGGADALFLNSEIIQLIESQCSMTLTQEEKDASYNVAVMDLTTERTAR
jgi:hypothetical protein